MKLSLNAIRNTSDKARATCDEILLYARRDASTLVEDSLQNTPFYAKQTQFQKKSNDVNSYNTTDYGRKRDWTLGENKPNSNPIKANLKRAKMNINSITTKDYRKNDDFLVRINKPNSKPISVKPKMNANAFLQKDYENETTFRPRKNKPNSNPISATPKLSKISTISILTQAKLTKYRWKILPAAAIFNPIKKLTIARTSANLKGRRVI